VKVKQPNERFQELNVVRLRDEVTEQFLVKPGRALQEPGQTEWTRDFIGQIGVDQPVLFQKRDPALRLSIEQGRAKRDLVFPRLPLQEGLD
jgi:hypothetical protein